MSVEQTQDDQPLARQHNEASKRKAYRSKATLSSEQNKLLSERERILLPFALRQLQKRIDVPADIQQRIFAQVPDAIASFNSYDLDAAKAIATYGKPRSFFYKKLAEYVNRMIQNPNDRECWAECLGENRGRPQGASHIATDASRLAIQAGIVLRERTGIHSDGSESTVTLQHGIDILEDVHPLGKGVIDAFHSVATTRREVQRLINEQPAVIKFVTESENTLRRDAKPKMMFQHKETDSLWCWDFCDLPNFFNDDGVIATGVLLAIIEMRHGVKLHIRVLLKKEINDKGMSLPRTYRIEDAAQFAATTMYLHGRRPEHFYNDRDPRFKALANSYPLLTEPGQTPIQTFSPPTDEPWPRGLLEVLFQRALNKFAARFDGKYNKRNRRTILNAIADPAKLPTTQKYENDLRKYLEDMDDVPVTRWTRKEGKVQKSRAGAYRNFVNPRACPPIRSLFHLPLNNKIEDWVVLDDFGFDFAVGGEKHFIPTVETEVELPDLMERWMDALLAKRKVHLFAIELDIGWVGEIYLGDRWYQIVPRSEYSFTHFQDNRAFDIAVSRIKQKGAALTEETMQEMLERFTSIPKRLNTSYSGRYVQQESAVNLPDVLVQAASTPIESSDPSAAQQENTAGQATRAQENAAGRSTGKQPSTKSSPKQATPQARTSRTVEDTVDWSDLFGE